MSTNSLYASDVDYAIVKALKDSREPLRYNKLHKEASNVLGRRIWIKTFNDHLKMLGENGEVIRNEKSRYNVTYESSRKYTDEERIRITQEKNLLDLFLQSATETSDLKLRTRIIQTWIGYLARKRRTELKILDATLALTEGKEREAQMILDEFFYGYRIVLDHLIKTLSKIDGITHIINGMREAKNRDLEKKKQEFDRVAKELYEICEEIDEVNSEKIKLDEAITKEIDSIGLDMSSARELREINETNIGLLLKLAELHEELTCV